MGRIIAHLGDCLEPQLPNCLPILRDRLKNEITRLTAVKVRFRPKLHQVQYLFSQMVWLSILELYQIENYMHVNWSVSNWCEIGSMGANNNTKEVLILALHV